MDQAEETFFDSTCPHCQHALSFPENEAGAVQDCPWCDAIIVVPVDQAAVAGTLPLPIVSTRLLLRPPALADAPQLAPILGDPDLFRYGEWAVLGLDEIEQAIEGQWANHLAQEAGSLGLTIEMEGQVIGAAWFSYRDQTRKQGAFLLAIRPASQRCGLGAEAVRALLGFGFNGMHLRRVAVSCDSRHEAARRTLEKAGMRREGEFLQNECINGIWIDSVVYAMLHDEYAHPPRRAAGDADQGGRA